MKYDIYQQNVITSKEENIMVIAGAGSGKTAVIVGRIGYLIDVLKVNPKSITVLSYTKKAVEELKERVKCDEVNICTIHSLAYAICKESLGQNLKIITNNIQLEIVEYYFKNILSQYDKKMIDGYFENQKSLKDTIIKLISSDSNIIIDTKSSKGKFLDNFFHKILSYYETIKKTNNYYDYKDLLKIAIKHFKYLGLSVKHLLVDEYQDLTDLKYKFIKEIKTVTNANLLVVGDDAQSIYRFNGSNINIFYNFEKDFEKVKIYRLKFTYRFSKELIEITSRFIENNNRQLKKELLSTKELNNPVIIKYCVSNNRKALALEKIIDSMSETNKILILGRYNFDIKLVLKNSNFIYQKNTNKVKYLKNPNYDITYLTVHSAKGLGFDEVIIINNENTIYGFPSKVTNNIVKENMKELIFEERRLFYVALTRTKNHVYCLVNIWHQSKFIKELKKIIKAKRK